MILVTLLHHRIRIGLRRYGRSARVGGYSSPTTRHPAVVDKSPWALREIGDRAGWLRALGSGTARLLPSGLAGVVLVAVFAFTLAVVGGLA